MVGWKDATTRVAAAEAFIYKARGGEAVACYRESPDNAVNKRLSRRYTRTLVAS